MANEDYIRPEEMQDSIDQIIQKYIRKHDQESINIEIFMKLIKSRWPQWYDDEKDARHYIRTRIQSLKDFSLDDDQGLIGNPTLKHYCHPKLKDDATFLNWREVWDEIWNKAKIAAENGEIFTGYNETVKVSVLGYEVKNEIQNVILLQSNGKKKDFNEDCVREAIIRLNTVAGRMQRPRKLLARNVLLVGLVERIEFDEDDFVIVTEEDYDMMTKFDSFNPDDQSKIKEAIKSLGDKEPPKKKRTVSNLVNEAKHRSRGRSSIRTSRKRVFELDNNDWIKEKEKLTHCEITGIKFADNFESGPFARSLDCRDPDLDYTIDNVDVVVSIYNLAKNKWPPEVVKEFCIEWHKNIDQ